eukprot:TRINITY_DN36725_c0_g1_i1.p1 TRINITY_DN36725_c0_g1~~TRINITY_DN36725_c0_g1_i1.p1  ORF type:complete len:399 (-),score=102.91 TRINITY_DN36725_c0_g1_i1:196-1392(-)
MATVKVSHNAGELYPEEVEGEKKLSTMRPKMEPLWKKHDAKAMKSGQRGTIYWVGKSIVGEDGTQTGLHEKGASYQGEWNANRKNGYGVQVFPNGQKYEGQWADGMRNGEGTLWVPVGKAQKLRKLYVGGWQADRRHGRGTCFFKEGQFFQGDWKQGKMHGQGTLRYSNGDLYIGEWDMDLRSGHGTLNKANGDCYEGYWMNDKREGSGSYFYAESGKVFVGEWADDLPKAGVYTQANPNPNQATLVPTTSVLPPVMLALPAEVLEGALAAVRNARKSFRACNTPLDRLFEHDELVALHSAFEGAMDHDGLVRPHQLQGLCSHLGTEVALPRLQKFLEDVGLPIREGQAATFDNFLRVVALLLDEEAANNPHGYSHDPEDGYWEEDVGDSLDAHLAQA